MEITKYLCEFFFGDFWHWLGLVVLVSAIFNKTIIKKGRKEEKEK